MFKIQTQNGIRNDGYGVQEGSSSLFAKWHGTTSMIDYSAKYASMTSAQSFAKSVDSVWTKELTTGKESRHAARETPELIARALREMDTEINSDKIPVREKLAHMRAIELHDRRRRPPPNCHRRGGSTDNNDECSCYVRTEYFRLRFLRVERYDPRKAALRYCRSLNVLHNYYGDVSLTRQLRMSDLTKQEIKFLKDGIIQLLPSRDPLGRNIRFLRRDPLLARANSGPDHRVLAVRRRSGRRRGAKTRIRFGG